MNQAQEQRLEEIFRKNENKEIAIAIKGCWGVGKTFFWNNFFRSQTIKEFETKENFYYEISKQQYLNVFENKKYAYVSLFGIESLDALKNEIAIKLGWNPHSQYKHAHYGIPQLLKNTLNQFKDLKFSHYGVSSSSRLIESLLFSQVKNVIICFDDFERLSEKLKIQDVMGLANQLKLERNCQLILILDESRTDKENQKKYAEYKEKLIDEEIKITSVEPLIRANVNDIDEPLVSLMVKFADELEIHNFRFFQKVIKLYNAFRKQLPEEVADSTKKIILIRILQGYFIADFGEKYEFQWENIKLVLEEKQIGWSERKIKTYEALRTISYNFIRSDVWLIEFKKWFDQSDKSDFKLLSELAESELISEENNKLTEKFHQIMRIFWGLQASENFPTELYEITKKVIGLDSLGNISFAINLLEMLGHQEKVNDLEKLTIEWINEKMIIDRKRFSQAESWGEIRDNFKCYIDNFDLATLPALIDAVFKKYISEACNNEDELSIEKANKQQWEELLFIQISQDERFNDMNSSYIVKKILERSRTSNFEVSFRQMIIEIYEEKGKKSEFYKNYMNYLISRLDK